MSDRGRLDVVLLGAPGSGKGTQAERIVAQFGLPHISTGDMLRAAVAAGSELGSNAQRYMQAGDLVPDEVVVGIIRERLAEPDAEQGFLLDGFPRTLEQAEALDGMLVAAGRRVTHVILLQVPEAELIERLSGRRMCRDCGKGYHLTFDPPETEGVCDVCGGELYQRADDNEETVRNRLLVYRRQTAPLIDYYAAQGIVHEVHGGGRMPDEVWTDVRAALSGDETA
jgi:adenylate kinase